MNAMRALIKFVLVAAVSTACGETSGQDASELTESPTRATTPAKRQYFVSVEQPASSAVAQPSDALQNASPATDQGSNTTPSETTGSLFSLPSITNAEADACGACWQPCCNPCPCVYGLVEALFFFRNPNIGNQPILVDAFTNTTFLSTGNLNGNFNPGMRVLFGVRLFGGRAIEFEYFSLFGTSSSTTVTNTDPNVFLIFPGNLSGNVFLDINNLQASYFSGLQSFAVNFPCCCGCGDECCDECGVSQVRCQSFSWFGGFRYINLSERLNLNAQRTVAGAVEQGSYDIRTANNLFGGQLGARFRRTQGRWGWEASTTGGIFGNSAQQSQTVTDFPNFPLRPTVSSSGVGAAFVGGANLTGLYLLNNVWNLRAGYSVLWIQGVALAPNQLDFNFATAPSGDQLHDNSGLLLHGINVGVEARW